MNMFFIGNRRKIVSVVVLAGLAIASLLYTQFVMDKITEQERSGVELWARAIEYNSREHHTDTRRELQQLLTELDSMEPSASQKRRWTRIIERAQSDLANAGIDFIANELIIKNRSEIPSVVTDADGTILHFRNVEERQLSQQLIDRFAAINDPIPIPVLDASGNTEYQLAYIGQSAVVQSLRFFPYIQFGLITIFLTLLYANLSSIRRTEQSNLWVGMAKEAAHQLGTPLSSMMGWITLLRSESQDPGTIKIAIELEEDVNRLQSVAERFNKIGSMPELKSMRLEPLLNEVLDYMERRLPRFGKNVTINREIDSSIRAAINSELFTWAMENLLKNALDAIDNTQADAKVDVRVFVENNQTVIEIEDSGKGIEKRYFEEIFRPGFSTKKRGWGLGLSLTQRIIVDNHGGRIYISRSVIGEGTTFRVLLPPSD
jgi:signal transduction histidine kinase